MPRNTPLLDSLSRATKRAVSHVTTCPPQRLVAYAIIVLVLVVIVCTVYMRSKQEPFSMGGELNPYLHGACTSKAASGRSTEGCRNYYVFDELMEFKAGLELQKPNALRIGGKGFKTFLDDMTAKMKREVQQAQRNFNAQADEYKRDADDKVNAMRSQQLPHTIVQCTYPTEDGRTEQGGTYLLTSNTLREIQGDATQWDANAAQNKVTLDCGSDSLKEMGLVFGENAPEK